MLVNLAIGSAAGVDWLLNEENNIFAKMIEDLKSAIENVDR